ncbi:MAG: HD domain-containing protein [Anaerolineaceae bacterium]|nr:HD domain-containing protein [Anaerolineaceae bacterium]
MRLYRDPVHGDILLSPLASDILNTPEFQRLSRVMQLGFAHLVFRGATHTRFAHSVGTYWISREILQHIRANHVRLRLPLPEGQFTDRPTGSSSLSFACLREVVSIAALLHDITHIPFGHTLEDELQDIYLKHDALAGPRLWFLLFDPRGRLAQLFERREAHLPGLDNATLRWLVYLILAFREDLDATPPAGFASLLEQARDEVASQERLAPQVRTAYAAFLGQALEKFNELSGRGLFQPFMADVVSGTVSADLLDYLARDLYFTGLRGGYDQRLMHYFFIGRHALTRTDRLALDVLSHRGYARIDITTEIMNLMRLRYSMAERVYYHKTKVAASAMLARGLLGHNLPADSNPYDDAESVLRPEFSDEEMVRRLAETTEGRPGGATATPVTPGALSAAEARHLGQAIYDRRLHVPVAVLTEATARRVGGAEKFVELLRGRPGGGRRLQETQVRLSSLTGLGADSVLVYCPPIKMQAKAITAPVRFEQNRIIPLAHHPDFSDEAELLNRKYRSLWKAFVFVTPQVLDIPGLAATITEEFCRRLEIPPTVVPQLLAVPGPLEE